MKSRETMKRETLDERKHLNQWKEFYQSRVPAPPVNGGGEWIVEDHPRQYRDYLDASPQKSVL